MQHRKTPGMRRNNADMAVDAITAGGHRPHQHAIELADGGSINGTPGFAGDGAAEGPRRRQKLHRGNFRIVRRGDAALMLQNETDKAPAVAAADVTAALGKGNTDVTRRPAHT